MKSYYNFHNHVVASQLPLRKTPLFLVGETPAVPTDQILPPTPHHYCDLNFVRAKRVKWIQEWLKEVAE